MRLVLSLLLSIGSISVGYCAGNPAIGKSSAIICVGCHESDGNSSNPQYPRLAAQGESYLAKQLHDLKNGQRAEEHMSSMVEAIEYSDIDNIAAYFSSQNRKTSLSNEPINLKGQAIFNKGIEAKTIPACAQCHGQTATGNPENKTPSLAGQHKTYLIKMLNAFRDHSRTNDPQKQMRVIAEKLSNKEIEAVSSYLSALP